jgi:hypothetical protein
LSRTARPLALLALAASATAAAFAHAPEAAAQPPASSSGVAVDSVAEYHGWYRWRFEGSEFVPCGVEASDRPWWVVPTVVAMQQRDSLVATVMPGGTGPVFVRVRGIAGARLRKGVGHLGANSRYFRLLEVLDMRPGDGAACPTRA